MVGFRSTAKVVTVTASTLAPTAAQSDCTFLLDRAGGIAVTLPTPASGLEYTFIILTAPTTTSTITSTSNGTDAANITYGPCYSGAGDAAANAAAEDVFSFILNSAVTGARVHYICDGTNWYIQGGATLAASITVA